LGDGKFVESVLKAADEQMKNTYDLLARGFNINGVATRIAEVLAVEPDKV